MTAETLPAPRKRTQRKILLILGLFLIGFGLVALQLEKVSLAASPIRIGLLLLAFWLASPLLEKRIDWSQWWTLERIIFFAGLLLLAWRPAWGIALLLLIALFVWCRRLFFGLCKRKDYLK